MRSIIAGLLVALVIASATPVVLAAVKNPQSGSVGLEATISSPPPTKPATISTPTGGSYSRLPVTVSGLCPEGILVKVFANNVFVGSAACSGGSYSSQVDLFSGANELLVRSYDNLDQAGPDSNKVAVTYSDPVLKNGENRVGLTSSYAKKGADPGSTLVWPIVLSGGNSPYALSIDWGDGKPLSLKSVAFNGSVDIEHVYDAAGQYKVIVKATDVNGVVAYLQLVGVANGEASSAAATDKSASGSTIVETKYSVIPSLVSLPLIFATFWLGRRYELKALRRRIEASAANEYQ